MISVSKLCCPICWHLLAILRGTSDDFDVCGHHLTLFLVILPAWLPTEVVVQMVDLFKTYLCCECIIMMNRHPSKHNRTSNQTDSGFSSGDEELVDLDMEEPPDLTFVYVEPEMPTGT
jgi:hypothetical protein